MKSNLNFKLFVFDRHIDEGDEIIIIEPFYDCYERMLNTTNGVIRYVPLRLVNSH